MTLFTNKYFLLVKSAWEILSAKIAVSLFIAIILSSSNWAYSQSAPRSLRVSGLVTDVSTGETLIGATVRVQGRNTGVPVDRAGHFSIEVPNANSVLIVTFVGYTEQEVPLEGKTVLDIKLSRVTTNLEEVVVQGFGLTTKKKTVAGAQATVSGEELSRSRATSASGALVGKVAGVNFRQAQGRPGSAPDIRIRNFGGNPLYVIDGVRRNLDAFNNLDFNDIESLNVLKDGSAAIYGMQAENGVIVVTTKKGKRNQKPTLGYDSYYGVQQIVNFNKPADIKSYIRGIVQTETYGNGITSTANRTITREEYDKWMAGGKGGAVPGYEGFDWYKYIYIDAPQSSHKVSISGGSDNADYYIAGTTISQKPMLRNFGDGLTRHNVQANVNATVSKRVKFGVQLNGYWSRLSNTNIPGDDYDFAGETSYRNLPTHRPFANDNPLYPQNSAAGDFTYSYGLVSPEFSGVESTTRRSVQINANLEIDILRGLKARMLGSYSFLSNQLDSRRKSPTLYSFNAATNSYNVAFSTENRNVDHVFTNTDNTSTNFQLEYKRSFGKHNMQANGGMETRLNYSPQIRVNGAPPANNIAFVPNILTFVTNVNDDISVYTPRHGYIVRLNYDYGGKYIAEFFGTYDGSPLFKPSKRYGFFPGGSVAYRISQEDFWKKSSFLTKINDFKVRASYGILGFENDGNFLTGYDYNPGNNNTAVAVLNGNTIIGSQARGLNSDYVTWGRSKSTNVGIDFTLLRNRLSITFDYFNRLRTGILAPRNDVFVPNLAGYTIGSENLNTDKNRGIDGNVSWRDRIGNVTYQIGGNFIYGRNITGFRYQQLFSSLYSRWRNPANDEGRLTGGTFQLITTGQFQNWTQIANHPIDQDGKGNQTLRPGDFIYQDTNNDGFINDLDRQIATYGINGGNPMLGFGFNMGASYKGFDIRMDFAGGSMFTFQQDAVSNNTAPNFMREWFPNQNTSQYLMDNSSYYSDIWDRNSPIIVGKYPMLLQQTPPPNTSYTSTGWQTSVTYVKLRNIDIGYTLPFSVMKPLGISNFKVYVSGQNVITFSNMPAKLDPEITSGGGQGYPNPRILTVGVQAKF
ncbi:SusC/RagA family TonB-linked outer membrane protein [Segetibacter sp. 3557_3]|uniref:SusC/RagA family TonB-linked outer membrane protein n=1 Tax=Segetibacter sp. 3557_3 TaxID=2547429 RepID=UPI001058B817|nr:SusC/RagA family TonB-linked outer membrane protein [Segetibacter sp. 3557_3]TDH28704.1 SusC/RagA family TonB-linked outer membrane protein [Segetibacter sp. 3557_3]